VTVRRLNRYEVIQSMESALLIVIVIDGDVYDVDLLWTAVVRLQSAKYFDAKLTRRQSTATITHSTLGRRQRTSIST